MDRGAWRPIVHSVIQSQTQLKQLSTHACMHETDIRASHEEVAVIQEVERKLLDAELKELMGKKKTELLGGDYKGNFSFFGISGWGIALDL